MDVFKIFFDTGYFDYTTYNLLIVQVPAICIFFYVHIYTLNKEKLQSPGIHIYVPYAWEQKNRHITYKRITKIIKAKENKNKKDQKYEF